ncbi:MAG: transcriptional regulator [Sphingomicrobium sp.]
MVATFAFDDFVLDPADRRLRRGSETVELNARYLDALALLVRERGGLVSKDRFLAEVWDGVPVTDEALTQCIKTLRSRLGDPAANPRFIQTVPKHGYRFIAPVRVIESEGGERLATPAGATAPAPALQQFATTIAAGTLGGGLAGTAGGLIYGFIGASQPAPQGVGALSVLLVLLGVTALVGLVGAAGVSLGLAGAQALRPRSLPWTIFGGAAGGLLVGALAKLFGLDAFTLLVGHSPREITGAAEGAMLGGAVGLGAWLAARAGSVAAGAARAAAVGGGAGALIGLAGGRLMLGSLALLAREVPGSRLRLDSIGHLFGESGFGPVTMVVTSGLEGALFAACTVAAINTVRQMR